MGALISKHAGAINMAMEGIMLTASLLAVIFSAMTGTVIMGLVGAIIGGLLISFLLAYMNLIKRSELVLTGIAFKYLCLRRNSISAIFDNWRKRFLKASQ